MSNENDLSIFESVKEEAVADIPLEELSLDKTKTRKSKKVVSVNGKIGEIVLNADDIQEGSVNGYFSYQKVLNIIQGLIDNGTLMNSGNLPKTDKIGGKDGSILVLSEGNAIDGKLSLDGLLSLMGEISDKAASVENELTVLKQAIVSALEEINLKLSDTEEVTLKNSIIEIKNYNLELWKKFEDLEEAVFTKLSESVVNFNKVKTSVTSIVDIINTLNNDFLGLKNEISSVSAKIIILNKSIISVSDAITEKLKLQEAMITKLQRDNSVLENNFSQLGIEFTNYKSEVTGKLSALEERVNNIGIINRIKKIFGRH